MTFYVLTKPIDMDFQYYINAINQDKLTFVAFPIYILAIILESFIAKEHKNVSYSKKDTWTSLSMVPLTAIAEFVPRIIAFMGFMYLHQISPLADIIGRQWWAWLLLIVIDDFTYYWYHRMNHEVRFFWAGHIPHHSSVHYNYSTALRQGVGERFTKFIFWIPIALLGFDPLMMFTVIGINLFYQFWVHTEAVDRLPKWYEAVLSTPSHHRVHHGSNIDYLDTNHGGIFIIWDKLFGTYAEERTDIQKTQYGLTSNINTYNPIKVATHEYQAIWKDVKRANSWTDKLKYIFFSPGWSHDGEDLRAKTLKKQKVQQAK